MRYKYIDTIKGIGIILVVLGHTYGIPAYLYNLIYSFHMPLFFILSGFVFNEEKVKELKLSNYARKKAKSYLLPYFLYAFINLAIELVWSKFYLREQITLATISQYIKGILICYSHKTHMPNCSPIWFFVCLFISSIVLWFITKYSPKFKWLYCLIFIVIGYVLSIYVSVMVPLKLATVFMATAFMIIGLYTKKCNNIIKIIIFASTIPAVFFAIKNGGNVGMNENTYGNLFMFIFAALSLSLALLFVCEKVDFDKTGCLAWLGKNTLPIIGFNYFLRDFTTEIYYFIPVINQYKIHWTISFIMTLGACVCLILIKNHIKTKIHNLRLKT